MLKVGMGGGGLMGEIISRSKDFRDLFTGSLLLHVMRSAVISQTLSLSRSRSPLYFSEVFHNL